MIDAGFPPSLWHTFWKPTYVVVVETDIRNQRCIDIRSSLLARSSCTSKHGQEKCALLEYCNAGLTRHRVSNHKLIYNELPGLSLDIYHACCMI